MFTQQFINLLIKQYWDKPRARAEIELQAGTWQRVYEFLRGFAQAFDLDTATGNRLDIIGRIVGLRRRPEFSDDEDYRFFLRVKIAKNTASAYMVSDTRNSLQEAIQFAFEGRAYVVDNQDMSLTLVIDSGFDQARLQLLFDLDLIPKPQGVQYYVTDLPPEGLWFGFSELGQATPDYIGGFGELGDDPLTGGMFSELIGG
ncbi:MAG TPA: DUF2612 domain-containing protein [Devosia sp.]|nr:DUF2612 domain-containing protein [Devosia sp.]